MELVLALSFHYYNTQSRLEEELRAVPKLKRYWRALQKKEKQADEEAREKVRRDSDFITNLIHIFLQVLSSIPKEGDCTLVGGCPYGCKCTTVHTV